MRTYLKANLQKWRAKTKEQDVKPIASSRVRPKSTAAPAGAASGPKVFFDGGCPLCRREIAHYRRIDRTGRLRWIDIASEPGTLSGYGLTLDRAMAVLHVLDSAGRWQRGIDGFLVIWMHLPAYRWLARLARILGLRAPLEVMYRQFARWRYRNRCGVDGCSIPGKMRGS